MASHPEALLAVFQSGEFDAYSLAPELMGASRATRIFSIGVVTPTSAVLEL
jgi:hypothetical protein